MLPDPYADLFPPLPRRHFGGQVARQPQPIGFNTPLSQPEMQDFLQREHPEAWYAGPLKFLGETLAKPSRPIKALVGKLSSHPEASWRELLAGVPFSDTLGITDPKEMMTGDKLAQKWGWIEDEDHPFWSWDTLKGLAVDAALDPLTYATFGAGGVVKGGVSAGVKAAGAAAKPGIIGRLAGHLPGKTAAGVAERAQIRAAEQAGKKALIEVGTAKGHLPLTEAGEVLSKYKQLPVSYGLRTAGFGSLEELPEEVVRAAATATGREQQILREIIRGATPIAEGGLGKAVPIQATARLSLPFTGGRVGFNVGTSPLGRALTTAVMPWGQLAGPVGDLWRAGRVPGSRIIRGLFDPSAGGQLHPLAQAASSDLQAAEQQAALRTGQAVPGASQALHDAGLGRLLGSDEANTRILRDLAENVLQPGALPSTEEATARAALEGPRRAMRESMERRIAQGEKLTPMDESVIRHWPRGATEAMGGFHTTETGAVLPGRTAGEIGREEIFQNVAANVVNDLRKDPVISSVARAGQGLPPGSTSNADAVLHVMNTYGRAVRQGGVNTPEQAAKIVDWLKTTPAQDVAESVGLFNRNPLVDAKLRLGSSANREALNQTLHQQLAVHAIPQEALAAANLAEAPVSLAQALDKLGLPKGHDYLTTQLGALLDRTIAPADLASYFITAENFKGIQALANPQVWQLPPLLKKIVDVYDTYTNLLKTYVTVPFPGHHLQNALGGVFQNWISGAAGLKGAQQAQSYLRTGLIPGMTKAESQQITRELSALGAFHRAGPTVSELTGPAATKAAAESLAIPGVTSWGERLVGPESWGQSGWWNPLATRGSKPGLLAGEQLTRSTVAPLRLAEGALEGADQLNRFTHFFNRLNQGRNVEGAWASTLATHLDYRALTPFEKTFMRRMLPFYSFARRNLSAQIGQMLNEPARQSIAVRLMHEAQKPGEEGPDAYIPDWLRGSAIFRMGDALKERNPISGRPFTSQTFGQLPSLPLEDLLRWIKTGREGQFDLEKSALNLAGNANPLIKLAAEKATGKDLYNQMQKELMATARWYEDPSEKLLRDVAAYTPAARFMSTYARAKKGFEPESRLEPWQVIASELGPVKFRDIDLEKSRRQDLLRGIEDVVSEVPGVKREAHTGQWYVPEEEQWKSLLSDLTQGTRHFETMRAYAGSREQAHLASLYRKIEDAEKAKEELGQLEARQATRSLGTSEHERYGDLYHAVQAQPKWLLEARLLEQQMALRRPGQRTHIPGSQGARRQIQNIKVGLRQPAPGG